MNIQQQAGTKFAIVGMEAKRQEWQALARDARQTQLSLLDELAATVPQDPEDPEYQRLTHRGRQLQEAYSSRNRPGEYIGSCSLEVHSRNLGDPDAWWHSMLYQWLLLGVADELNCSELLTAAILGS